MHLKNLYILVRHGEAENNVLKISDTLGNPENHLTEKGRKQAAATAEKLPIKSVDKIITSPFARAKETAEVLAGYLKFEPAKIITDARAGEMRHGSEGHWKPYEPYIFTQGPTAELNLKRGNDGESYRDVQSRMLDIVHACESSDSEKNIIIVSHADPIILLMSVIMELDDKGILEYTRTTSIPQAGAVLIKSDSPPEFLQ